MSSSAIEDTSAGDESMNHKAHDLQGSTSANSRPPRTFNLHESCGPTATYSPGMGSFEGYHLYPVANAPLLATDTNVFAQRIGSLSMGTGGGLSKLSFKINNKFLMSDQW
jgi:hypothetical protein